LSEAEAAFSCFIFCASQHGSSSVEAFFLLLPFLSFLLGVSAPFSPFTLALGETVLSTRLMSAFVALTTCSAYGLTDVDAAPAADDDEDDDDDDDDDDGGGGEDDNCCCCCCCF
jgi:hypothetical protein